MGRAIIKEMPVSKGFQATIPAEIRKKMGINSGDLIRWIYINGKLEVQVIKRRLGTFKDFKPYDIGVKTDAVRDHDKVL